MKSIPGFLASHFRLPRGIIGKYVCTLMNKGNANIYHYTKELFDFEKIDRVLEIGFGSGQIITELLAEYDFDLIAGVDPSKACLKSAEKMLATQIASGKAVIKFGSAEEIPFDDKTFSKIFTVNTLYFWPDPVKGLREIQRVLKDDGLFVISIRTRAALNLLKFTDDKLFTKYSKEEAIKLVEENGFEVTKSVHEKDVALDAFCILMRKANVPPISI